MVSKLRHLLSIPSFFAALMIAACGSSDGETDAPAGVAANGGSGAAAGSGGSSAGGQAGSAGATGGTAGAAGGMAGSAGVAGASGGGAGQAGAAGTSGAGGTSGSTNDPAQPGPFTLTSVDASVEVSAVGTSFTTRCFLPDTEPGPFPLITLAHGFQLPASQYYLSAQHLASFGFVVCVPEYPAGLFNPNHANNARELLGVIDWALGASSPIAAKIDPQRIGATGHSLGGKLSVIAASLDDRIKAVFGIDPIDSSKNCNPTDCPDATDLLPLPIPTGFVGETIDAQASFQACAPAESNFETFFAGASSPTFKVHVEGANHMSFLDDPASCGLPCSFCNAATRDHDEVASLLHAYLAAFFLRHLNGEAGYDDYLTGPTAQQRYVQTGVATIELK
jgi:predicted dienelactone hydrolase